MRNIKLFEEFKNKIVIDNNCISISDIEGGKFLITIKNCPENEHLYSFYRDTPETSNPLKSNTIIDLENQKAFVAYSGQYIDYNKFKDIVDRLSNIRLEEYSK